MTEQEYLEHAKMIWKTLVPKNGHAETISGELVRCVENLRDEAQRNGNKNWGRRFSFKANFIRDTLIPSGIFSPETVDEINRDIDSILEYEFPETSEIVYDRLLYRIVDWDLKMPGRQKLSDHFLAEAAEHDDSAFMAPVPTSVKYSPLRQAILEQDTETVQQLIGTGTEVDETGEFNSTPLGTAAAVGNIDIIRLLLNAGADINHLDSLGQSILDMSQYRPEAKIFLKEQGAKSGKQLQKAEKEKNKDA